MADKYGARKFIVMVGGGSGSLVRPMGEDVMYILTANHVIKDNLGKPLKIERFSTAEKKYVDLPFGIAEEGKNYFPHDELDAAILKVPLFEESDGLMPLEADDDAVDEFDLYGFPATRDDDGDPFRENAVKLLDYKLTGLREGEIPGNADWDEVVGQSGGGIVRKYKDSYLITGVQAKMAGKKENMGRIYFAPISVFDEIVAKYSDDLKPLLPYFLLSFELLKEVAMELKGHTNTKDLATAKSCLQALTEKIVDQKFIPYEMRTLFGRRMLFGRSTNADLLVRKLWSSWLEYLIVLTVCDVSVSPEKLEDCLRKHRFVFGNVELDWTAHVPELIAADFDDVMDNGLVLVSTPLPPAVHHELDPELVVDIATIESGLGNFDISSGAKVLGLRFLHLHSFQGQAIIKNYKIYRALDPRDAKKVLDQLRSDFLKLMNATNN